MARRGAGGVDEVSDLHILFCLDSKRLGRTKSHVTFKTDVGILRHVSFHTWAFESGKSSLRITKKNHQNDYRKTNKEIYKCSENIQYGSSESIPYSPSFHCKDSHILTVQKQEPQKVCDQQHYNSELIDMSSNSFHNKHNQAS